MQKYSHIEDFRIRGAIGYQAKPRAGQYSDYIDEVEAAPYILVGEQVLEGVPLLFTNRIATRYMAGSSFDLELYAKKIRILYGSSLQPTGILYDDVPLLPWPDIQKVFEENYLKTGKIVDVYSVEMGCELAITRKGPKTVAGYNGDLKKYPKGTFDEICHVRPVWVLKGYDPPRGPAWKSPCPKPPSPGSWAC